MNATFHISCYLAHSNKYETNDMKKKAHFKIMK